MESKYLDSIIMIDLVLTIGYKFITLTINEQPDDDIPVVPIASNFYLSIVFQSLENLILSSHQDYACLLNEHKPGKI